MLTRINKNRKCENFFLKNRVITMYDIKLIAHNDVRFDNWLVLQK